MRTWVKGRTLLPLLGIALVCVLFLALWAGGRRAVPLEGTVQTGPEQSAFFPDGDCSRKPFWFNWPDERDYDMNAKIRGLEYPDALRVKLIGNLSRLGEYGHLGGYPREVWPIKVISVTPAPPCWPGKQKPDFYDWVSQTLVGQRITIRGKFSLRGKIGPYIALEEKQEVYLVHRGSYTWSKRYSEMEGKRVAATGILRYYHAPPAEPTDRPVARALDHFYFDADTTHLWLYGQ